MMLNLLCGEYQRTMCSTVSAAGVLISLTDYHRVEQFSYVPPVEEHHTCMISPDGRNINLELEPGFLRRYEIHESQFEKLTETSGSSSIMLRLYKELDFQDSSFSESLDMLIPLDPNYVESKTMGNKNTIKT